MPHRVVSDDRFHPKQIWDRRIFPHPLDRRKAAPIRERRHPERREHCLARINHTFLNKFFFTERTEFRTEVAEPNTLSAL